MAILTDIFGKKPKPGEDIPASSQKAEIPVDEVIQLRSQGLTNNQIIQTLQSSGYSLPQINNALSQAEIKGTVEPTIMEEKTMPENPMQFQPPPVQPQPGAPPPGPTGAPMPAPGIPPQQKTDVSRVEEIAEAIIDEKWDDLIKSIEKVINWKEKVEARIVTIEQQIKSLKEDFDKLHTSVLEKIGEYDQSITTVGTNIKALEQVFKKVLPGFVENVNDLGRIAETMKKSTAKKK